MTGVVVDPPERGHAAAVHQHRRDLVLRGADDRQLGGHVAAQRLEGAQQHRQALALDRLADEHDPQRLTRRTQRRCRHSAFGQPNAVRHDPVVAAVEAPAGPRRRLGDREAQIQPVELAACPHQPGDQVRRHRLRIAVERADERCVGARQGVPADDRGHRLVQVHDVGREGAQLAPHRGHRMRAVREVGHRAVRRPAERAAQRHQPRGNLARLRARATVRDRGRAGIAVERCEHAHLVTCGRELGGEGFDVARDAARVRPRVRRDEGNPHRGHPKGRAGCLGAVSPHQRGAGTAAPHGGTGCRPPVPFLSFVKHDA